MSVFGGGKPCEGCSKRDEIIEILTGQLRDREKSVLAVLNPAALRARFPEPKAPPAPAAPAESPVITTEMRRGQTYTPPAGRDAFEVERDFEVEDKIQ